MRWLEDELHDQLSEDMLALEARILAEEIRSELRYAGVRVPVGGRPGAER